MKILAYDTSGPVLTAALADGAKLLAEAEAEPGTKYASALVPMLKSLLGRARWKPSQIDVLAVGVGPGSFTGIRVGVATAKMLSFVWNTKLVAVSSLEAIAHAFRGAGEPVAVSLDARRGKIYAALFETGGPGLRARLGPMLSTRDEFSRRIGQARLIQDVAHVRASAVAAAGYEKARRREFVTADTLEPLYLHPKDVNVTKK